jgi:hypothetical protein
MINKQFIINSLAKHYQRYPYSCFSSAIEMMQIIESKKNNCKLPTVQTFLLQDKYTDYFTEHFFHRDYQTDYFGLKFQKMTTTSMSDPDFSTTIRTIDCELQSDKMVLIETWWDNYIHAHVLFNFDVDENGIKTYHSVTGCYGNPTIEFKDWSVGNLQNAMITPNNVSTIWLYKII